MFKNMFQLNILSPMLYIELFIFSVAIGMMIGQGSMSLPQVVTFYKSYIEGIIKKDGGAE